MKYFSLFCVAFVPCFAHAQDAAPTNSPPAALEAARDGSWWNFHMANTDVGQLHPSFPAQYSGPNSLNNHFESAETISVDNFAGLRLWRGAEFHLDALAW